MGKIGPAAGGRAANALRLFILIVIVLIVYQYLFSWSFGADSIKTYVYNPFYNATQTMFRDAKTPIKNDTAAINNTNTLDAVNNSAFTEEQVGENNNELKTKVKEVVDATLPIEENSKPTEPLSLYCNSTQRDLGSVPVDKTKMALTFVENKFPELKIGGRYTPNCTAPDKVAIIVPYKDREQHLAIFLNHIHPFLMKQQIAYGIFVIEQNGTSSFNRAKLMNVGFVESEKLEPGGWQCFIFHDVDLLPLDTRNLYTCPEQPRHMSAAIDVFKNKLPYNEIFGGVSALTREQFTKVNGFSNKYWGWGGEDDDMFKRLNEMKYSLSRYDMEIAKYTMLQHKKSKPNPQRYNVLSNTTKTFQTDGLSNLEYEVIAMVRHHTYTYLLVDIDENR